MIGPSREIRTLKFQSLSLLPIPIRLGWDDDDQHGDQPVCT